MTTKYTKISDDEYQITEPKEEVRIVSLKFVEADILHKDKLIAELQSEIVKLQEVKAELVTLRDALLKAK